MRDGVNPQTGSEPGSEPDSDSPEPEAAPSPGVETRQMMDAVGRNLFGEEEGEPVRVGRFVVVRRLGEGAMGLVYLAYDSDLDRRVAIKVLRKRYVEVAGERMLREGRALARLSHPNVVTVYEVGKVDEQVFVAMEYVEGGTLRQWAEAHPCRTATDVAAVLDKFIQAGAGLAKAHASEVIHRDFKPDNVLVDAEGNVRVADFGLAAPATDPKDDEVASSHASWPSGEGGRLTRTGEVVGTPVYMAPEQMVAASADARSDQYAFCVSLYEALYGERPYEAKSLTALRQATLFGDPPRPPSGVVPGWVGAVVVRGLSREAADRYPNMEALLAALADDPARRRRRVLWSSAGVVVLGATAAVAYSSGQQTRTAAAAIDPCAGVDAGLQDLWSAQTREAVEAGLTGLAQSWATRNAELTLSKLDVYAAAWGEGRRDNCEATRGRSEQSEAMFDRREGCYRRAAAWMETLTEAFAHADADIARRSVDAVGALPPLAACSAVDLLGELAPIPADMESAVSDSRTAMARLDAKITLGQGGEVAAQIDAAKDVALAVAYPPLHAEAHQIAAEVLADRGNYEEAARGYADAFAAALRSRHDEIMAAAAVGAFDMWGPTLRKFELAGPWLEHAQAAVDRLAPDSRHRWKLTSLEAEVACRKAELEACVSLHERALKEYETAEDRGEALEAKLQGRYAVALSFTGDVDGALAVEQRVLAMFEEAFGPDHPNASVARANTAVNLHIRGRLTEARALLERAIEELSATYPDGHDALANALGSAAVTMMKLGEHDAAAEYGRRAQDMYAAVLGAEHPQVGSALRIRGRNAHAARRYTEAIEFATAAVALREQIGAPSSADDLSLLGAAQLQLGRLDQAQATLERAVEIEEGIQPGSPWSASHHERLARLHLRRGDRSRAQTHIDAALKVRATEPKPDPGGDRVHATAAMVAAARGDTEAAREHWAASIECANAQKPPGASSIARAKLGLARLARTDGDDEAAHKLAGEGLAAAGDRAGDGVMLRGQLHALLAQLVSDPADQARHRKAARAEFETLDPGDIENRLSR